jgi:hypothetical protein
VAVNDAPVAGDVLLPGATENAPFAFTAAQLLAHASDVDGDALTVPSVAAASTAGGVVAWDAGAGTGTYTPPNHFHGPDSWTFTVSDGHGGTATATANVDVGEHENALIYLTCLPFHVGVIFEYFQQAPHLDDDRQSIN